MSKARTFHKANNCCVMVLSIALHRHKLSAHRHHDRTWCIQVASSCPACLRHLAPVQPPSEPSRCPC